MVEALKLDNCARIIPYKEQLPIRYRRGIGKKTFQCVISLKWKKSSLCLSILMVPRSERKIRVNFKHEISEDWNIVFFFCALIKKTKEEKQINGGRGESFLCFVCIDLFSLIMGTNQDIAIKRIDYNSTTQRKRKQRPWSRSLTLFDGFLPDNVRNQCRKRYCSTAKQK